MKYFYSHLIKIESILTELDKLDLDYQQKHHLTKLLDSSLHHTVLDAILSQLSDQDKRSFMLHLKGEDEDKIWEFLNKKIEKVEEKIKKAAEDLRNQLHEDIKKAKQTP